MRIYEWFKNLFVKNTAELAPIKVEPPMPQEVKREVEVRLSWEKSKPEAKQWTKALWQAVADAHDVLSKAQDWERIYPHFKISEKKLQIKIMAELLVAVAYYESGWNPKSQAVDVGTKADKNSWSIGLYQVSVCDQKNLKLPMAYTFEALIMAEPNIQLMMAILKRQVEKYGKIILDNNSRGKYWAVILDGNKYQKISQIIDRMNAALKA
jgi:hypothetical protein